MTSRFLPDKPLPPYAYLPGRFPHPVRDPGGHSHGAPEAVATEPLLESEAFFWGLDLFNHGYYWEAHEAWEPLWRAAPRGDARRALLKGLILLAAAGVKIREGKRGASLKHAGRAAALLREVAATAPDLATCLGMAPVDLAAHAAKISDHDMGSALTAFPFVLGPNATLSR